jgi:hypothetical protein
MSEVFPALGEVYGQLLMIAPTPTDRERWLKFAHECVDAGLQYAATGVPVIVMSPDKAPDVATANHKPKN